MSSGDDPALPQELVADKYRLTRLLGRGGMGSVWEGVHTTLGTRVAVKFIEAEYVESREARSRFENEAHAAAKLRSKHVVQVSDHGMMADGRPYIVMEFLAGEPLDARLDRMGRLPPAETARIVLQLGRALAKAHEAGIVHRDLKPENIFLVRDDDDGADVVKVVDFGIAKFTVGNLGVSSSTRTGSVLGTPYYMSPEQARGLRSVDHRSDIWSVGVIAYRCLVGALPFDGESVGDLLVKICTAPLPVPSQQAPVPQGFDAWFSKALEREPAGRFASALDMAEQLCALCGVPTRSRQSSIDGLPAPPMMVMAQNPGVTAPSVTPPLSAGAVRAESLSAGTVSPTTQTPAELRRSRRPVLFLALVSIVAMAVAGVVVTRFVAAPDEIAETPPADPTAAPQPEQPAAAAQPVAPPPVEQPPAAAEPEPNKEPPAPAASSAPPAPKKVVSRPRPAKTAAPKAAPAPAVTPKAAPAAEAKPKVEPKPARQGIDVGY